MATQVVATGRPRGRPKGVPDKKPRVRRDLNCAACGERFVANTTLAKYCSNQCRYAVVAPKTHRCVICGSAFYSRQHRIATCSPECASKLRSKNARRPGIAKGGKPRKWASRADAYRYWGAVRRSRIEGAERFSVDEIFERDGWLCQICGEEVSRFVAWPHPRSASLDHKVPLARGGKHTPENTQCAHLGCNSRKGARQAVAA